MVLEKTLESPLVHSPTICHGLAAGDLEIWNCTALMKLFLYIDDVLLTSDSFADVKQCTVKAVSHDVHCTVKAMYYDVDSEL